jgi:hypothetical protein
VVAPATLMRSCDLRSQAQLIHRYNLKPDNGVQAFGQTNLRSVDRLAGTRTGWASAHLLGLWGRQCFPTPTTTAAVARRLGGALPGSNGLGTMKSAVAKSTVRLPLVAQVCSSQ